MNLFLSVAAMTTILCIMLLATFKITMRLIRWALMTNKALNLLAESREIENLPAKTERFKALMDWKIKRDSLLERAESLDRKLSEAED